MNEKRSLLGAKEEVIKQERHLPLAFVTSGSLAGHMTTVENNDRGNLIVLKKTDSVHEVINVSELLLPISV